jgi:hypothetical protein
MVMKRRSAVITVKTISGEGIFVYADGKRIAMRGAPGTPQARTWVSLEPGWTVLDNSDLTELIVKRDGVTMH